MHSNKKMPNAIPYVTSYYKKNWGFCITENQKKIISDNYEKKDLFKIVINSVVKSLEEIKPCSINFVILSKTNFEFFIYLYNILM